MTALTRVRFANYAWTIEHDHRVLQQDCGVERAHIRAAHTQRHYTHRSGTARFPSRGRALASRRDQLVWSENRHHSIRRTGLFFQKNQYIASNYVTPIGEKR